MSHSTSIGFARMSSHVADFNARNKSLTAKLLQQGYWYHKLRKTFSKFYRRHYELVCKFSVGLKKILHQSLSEPEVYSDLSKVLEDHGRHSMLSFLSSLPISVLRILDTEANKFYDRNHQLYDAALLTRCYTQHALRPFIDSEINHKRYFIIHKNSFHK